MKKLEQGMKKKGKGYILDIDRYRGGRKTKQ